MSHSPKAKGTVGDPTTPEPQLAQIRRLEDYQYVVEELPNSEYSIELHCPPEITCPPQPNNQISSLNKPGHQIALLSTSPFTPDTLHIHAINVAHDHRPEAENGCPHASAIYLAFWTHTLHRDVSALRRLHHHAVAEPSMVAVCREVYRLCGAFAPQYRLEIAADWPEATVLRECYDMLVGSKYGLSAGAVVSRCEEMAPRGLGIGGFRFFRYTDCADRLRFAIEIEFEERCEVAAK